MIVVGGFGGIHAARALAAYPVRITRIDRENYHLFQPLLYQGATAALSPSDIAEPIRFILRRHANVRVVLGEVNRLDLDERSVALADGSSMGYDAVIVATGSRYAHFGHDEWELLAPGLKSLEDALEVRPRVLSAFEAAEVDADDVTRDALLTFVVVGGGPAGVRTGRLTF